MFMGQPTMTSSLLAVEDDVFGPQPTTLTTINPIEKMPSLGSQPRSILAFQDLCLPVLLLGKLPKRLAPRVEVNQRGLHSIAVKMTLCHSLHC